MSAINTNGLNTNFPTPGVTNNPSQGFRDNFTSIKTNLDTAASEITDLQNKVVVKAALNGANVNNDMANTLISNASIRSFRSTTYNLGNALSGTVVVNTALADVFYGTVTANTTLQFGSWGPINTQSAITLKLGIANTNAVISFPSEVVATDNFGGALLENATIVGNVLTITAPFNVTELNYTLKTLDCGNTISIEPLNRPYQAGQISKRTPPPTGDIGDVVGTIYVDSSPAPQIAIEETYANNALETNDTSSLYSGQAIVFTGGEGPIGNITLGTTYYVNSIISSTLFNMCTDPELTTPLDTTADNGYMLANPVNYMYIATDNYNASTYNRNIDSTTAPNIITVSGSTANIYIGSPVIFTGTGTGNTANITLNQVYFIKDITGSNVTISRTRYNGIPGPEFDGIDTVSSGNVDIDYTVYDGFDIFKRIPLMPY